MDYARMYFLIITQNSKGINHDRYHRRGRVHRQRLGLEVK